jgi:hypothetical protein
MDDGVKKADEKVIKDAEADDVEKGAHVRVQTGGEEVARTHTSALHPGLPLSKAKTVALVATVAAAPFLSVSLWLR